MDENVVVLRNILNYDSLLLLFHENLIIWSHMVGQNDIFYKIFKFNILICLETQKQWNYLPKSVTKKTSSSFKFKIYSENILKTIRFYLWFGPFAFVRFLCLKTATRFVFKIQQKFFNFNSTAKFSEPWKFSKRFFLLKFLFIQFPSLCWNKNALKNHSAWKKIIFFLVKRTKTTFHRHLIA